MKVINICAGKLVFCYSSLNVYVSLDEGVPVLTLKLLQFFQKKFSFSLDELESKTR